MIKSIPVVIFLSICSLTAFAQQELVHPKERSQPVQVVTTEASPYMQVNKLPTNRQAFIANPHSIKSMEVYKGADAVARFGEKAKDGAIVVAMNPNVQLVRMKDIYSYFNIPLPQRALKVCINNQPIKNPDLILADLKEVKKVEVIKQDLTALYRWSLDEDEQFLHIITADKK